MIDDWNVAYKDICAFFIYNLKVKNIKKNKNNKKMAN